MAGQPFDAVNIDLHEQAEQLTRRYIDDFATSLVLQAKLLAFRKGDELVLSNHVDEAFDSVTQEQGYSPRRQILLFIGSALFGAFVQGFVTELFNDRPALVAIYTMMGFIGLSLAFWSFRRR